MKAEKIARKPWPKVIKVGNCAVKIYLNKEPTNASGWAYVLAWQTASGRMRQKFSDEADALEEARTKAAQLNAGRVEGAEMTRGDRDELSAARRLVGSVPLLSALHEWAKANQLTTGNVLAAAKAWSARNVKVEKRLKVTDVVKQFLKAKTAAGKNVAIDHADSFRRMTETFGEFSIDTVAAN